jgi:putative ABC transport system substrate-binding protein
MRLSCAGLVHFARAEEGLVRISIRSFIVALAAVAVPLAAPAQPGKTVHRIGFIGNSTPTLEANLLGPFREGLRERGYVEGRNLTIEYRWAEGDYARLPALVNELIASKVEVLVGAGTPVALAVKRATTTVPMVMVAVGDPVGTGLVASLARPGGNLTGLVSIAPDLEGKRLQLLREVVPKLSHVSVLTNPANAYTVSSVEQIRQAAHVLHLKTHFANVRTEGELTQALDAIAGERPDGLIMVADRVFLHNRDRIAGFATRHRLPGVYAYSELVDAGGLMSFGPSYPGMHRRAAYYVDRILKGANPADLPMEQPETFELIVNLKTAKAFGLAIPQSLLLRADRLIQ